jgi:hypothetical protein
VEESEKKSNELPIPAIASIVLALLGILVQHLNPLDSSRPTVPNGESSQYVNIEDVNSRLWQDPFTSISSHDPSKDKTKNCRPPEPNQKNLESSSPQAGKTANKSKGKPESTCSPVPKHTIAALAKSIVEMTNKENPNITVCQTALKTFH